MNEAGLRSLKRNGQRTDTRAFLQRMRPTTQEQTTWPAACPRLDDDGNPLGTPEGSHLRKSWAGTTASIAAHNCRTSVECPRRRRARTLGKGSGTTSSAGAEQALRGSSPGGDRAREQNLVSNPAGGPQPGAISGPQCCPPKASTDSRWTPFRGKTEGHFLALILGPPCPAPFGRRIRTPTQEKPARVQSISVWKT